MRYANLFALLSLLFSVAGFALGGEKVNAFVSILPQKYFLARVGGDRVNASVLVQPGKSPATYTPTVKQMTTLSRADVYFRIGVPFENAVLPKIEKTMPGLPVVDTRKGIELIAMAAHHHHEEKHEGDHEHGEHEDEHHEHAEHEGEHEADGRDDHEHGGKDPHIWLDPNLVKIQARTMRDALSELDPEGAETYKTNCAAFVEDLDALDRKLRQTLAPMKGKNLFVYHPAFGYFARAYELEQRPIEIAGKSPSARKLAELIEQMKKEGARVIFVQPQFSRKSAEIIADAVGGAVVAMNPLAEDYIANLESMAEAVKKGMTSPK